MLGVNRYLIFTFIFSGLIVLVNLNTRAENYSYYISPDGNDAWEGTIPDKPFATIQKARDVIRKINKGEDTIIVRLRGGEYILTEPFALGPGDSGTGSCPVIYTAMPGETPIFKAYRSHGTGDPGRLLVLLGEPEKKQYVEHIIISGITFSGAGITAPDDKHPPERRPAMSSLIALEYVRFCSFNDNVIRDSQLPAIQISGEDIAVSGNRISGINGGAIHIKGKRFTISDNFINDIHYTDERERPGWGICLDSSTAETNIMNNIITGAGISLWLKGMNKNVSITNNVFVNPDLSLVKLSNPANRNHEHIRLTRNIFYYRKDDVDVFSVSGIRSLPEVSDSNVFWNPTACIWTSMVIRGIGPTTRFTEWQSLGLDARSLVENPLFVDINNDNYSLKEESVAFMIGFREKDLPDTKQYNH